MNSHLFKTGGPLTEEDATVYIVREADRDSVIHLQKMEYLLFIESRQQGKTSLIHYLIRHPAFDHVAFVYIHLNPSEKFSNEITWYQSLCKRIERQLKKKGLVKQDLEIPENNEGWRSFLSTISLIASEANTRIVIALDEIGAVTIPGSTHFFSVLRDVFNSRPTEPEFKQLTFLLSGAFHPRNLIENDDISPFNIAQRVRLRDFTIEQVQTLVSKGEWSKEQISGLTERIYYWTEGQPYLSQLLCSYLKPEATVEDVDVAVERLRREDENHLPPMLERLTKDNDLYKYVMRILSGERIKFYPGEHHKQDRLELLGVLKADGEGYCKIRNRIYEQILSPKTEKDVLNLLYQAHRREPGEWVSSEFVRETLSITREQLSDFIHKLEEQGFIEAKHLRQKALLKITADGVAISI